MHSYFTHNAQPNRSLLTAVRTVVALRAGAAGFSAVRGRGDVSTCQRKFFSPLLLPFCPLLTLSLLNAMKERQTALVFHVCFWFRQSSCLKCQVINQQSKSTTGRLLNIRRLPILARKTLAPLWSLSKLFVLTDLVVKSLQKIRSENTQKRRPRGSSVKHGKIWPAKFGQMCLPQILQVYLLHLSEL